MQADPNRKTGFYWVRFEGAVIVAYHRAGLVRRLGTRAHWYVPGLTTCFRDDEVSELLAGPLFLTDAAPKSPARLPL